MNAARGDRERLSGADRMPPACAGGIPSAVPSGAAAVPEARMEGPLPRAPRGGFVVYINSETVGGDQAGGRDLMRAFLYTLTEVAPQPAAIILVGSAVRLAVPGSAALESLSVMAEQGVSILVAEPSARLLPGPVAVGKAATMHAVLQALIRAEKVIVP
ncbi:MAG: hypothetical protein PHN82_02340 [bacterium]|nr:hypothetical protein [bacterium]